jgi:hypothetical protein
MSRQGGATSPAPGQRGPRRSWPAGILRAVWIVAIIFGILAIVGGDPGGGGAFAGIGVAGIAWQEFRYYRRRRRM